MIKVKTLLIFFCLCILISSCSNKVVPGDALYIPKEYKDKLETMKMTEIAPMPYFKSPFITIAKDSERNQYAVVFRENEEVGKVTLPKTYEDIVAVFESKSCKVEKYDLGFSNLHLLEINSKLYWNFSDGEKNIYLNLQGAEEDPFAKK